MVEKSKNQKTNFVSEEDISTVLQRYTATTVLSFLQEVAQVQDVKIDWNALAKKTTTGISNAREYQMLWRHLAYRDTLVDRLDDAARPLDDDSDLECDLEAFPAVSSEASAEAAACVKVLIASSVSNDPNGLTVEAPLTINIPKGQMSDGPENSHFTSNTQGMNITVPVSVQKQPLTANTISEALDSNGAASAHLPRRKRKPWSPDEDMELIDAVQKCGEGNWANILKGDFKGDRTASQLSQRWAIIKKRLGNPNVGTGSQLSEAQLATRRAVSLALNLPMGNKLKTSCLTASGSSLCISLYLWFSLVAWMAKACAYFCLVSIYGQTVCAGANSNASHSNIGEPAGTQTSAMVTQSLPPSQRDFMPNAAASGSSKVRVATKKPSTKSGLSPDAMVKAAAVAAGARIATPSDAASLIKAAQSKNLVHIMPGAGNANSLPSNVHFIRTGPASKPHSSYSAGSLNASQPGGQVRGPCTKPATPVTWPSSAISSPDLSASSDVKSAALSIPISRLGIKTGEDDATSNSSDTRKELVQEDRAGFPCKEQIEEMETDHNPFSGTTPTDRNPSESPFEDKVHRGQSSEVKATKEQAEGDELSASASVLK